jgi:hypothetical protein
MKYFLSVCLFLIMITSFAPKTGMDKRQLEKTGTLILTKEEAADLYTAVDDAAIPGNIRKPLLQKIVTMFQTTWPAPAPKTDSSVNPIKP